MAKGRMINNTVVFDAKIHRLSCDTSRLAFTWLITFADVEGRTYGEPAIVRSLVFPRRSDVTIENIGAYIAEWEREKLITFYESNGDTWIQFNNFDKNQIGLRKDREAPSSIPAPPVRNKSGASPEQLQVNRTEKKRKEEEEKRRGEVFKKYENNIAAITESSTKTILLWIEENPTDWILEAIDIAVHQNKRRPSYVSGILRNWQEDGKDSKKKPKEEAAAEVY